MNGGQATSGRSGVGRKTGRGKGIKRAERQEWQNDRPARPEPGGNAPAFYALVRVESTPLASELTLLPNST